VALDQQKNLGVAMTPKQFAGGFAERPCGPARRSVAALKADLHNRAQKRTDRAKNKKPAGANLLAIFDLAPRPGLEPGTYGLTVRRSTN
jgi:hypothetical protein